MFKYLNKNFYFLVREEGATSIEFALVSVPFIIIAIGIIEISVMFATGNLLEGGVGDAARLIRTGQIQQSAGDPEDLFRNELCNGISSLVNCDEIGYEVVPMGSNSFFEANTLEANFDANDEFDPRGFDPGGVNDVVMVRAVYDYALITPIISQLITAEANGKMRMVSTTVFQNEPYEFVAP